MKILIYFLLTACLYSGELLAQKEEIVKSAVETMPSFPGGVIEMYKFLNENIRYPVEARRMKISGQVITQFIVDRYGYLRDIHVERGVDPSLDKEALRVVELMNERVGWIPGTHNGNPVDVVFTLPLKFVLQ